MDIDIIFSNLKEIAVIGTEGCKSSQWISHTTTAITDFINACNVTKPHPKSIPIFEEFSSEFGETNVWREDERLFCAVSSLYLLNYSLIILDEEQEHPMRNTYETEPLQSKGMKKGPEPPPDLISLQQQQTIEACVKYIVYSSYFGSLDEDAVMYLKMKVMQEETALTSNIITVAPCHRHGVLKLMLKYLLPLIKHEFIGILLQRSFLPELLCGFLQLSFSPEDTSRYPEDVPFFRQELEALINTISSSQILKGILLLKGVTAQKKGKCWLRTVCQSLYTRRFLLKEDGVSLVLEAALSVGDFSDWRKKEVVAALISSARTPDEIYFFERLCPQILALLKDVKKDGNIFQILAFSVCQLTKRSPQLSQTHLFDPLLAPLANLTSTQLPDAIRGEGLVTTVSTLYKLFVQVLPPTAELKSFLEPVLCPLASIAALPPTCHVRTDAQLVLVRYLSQLESDEAVSTLLIIAGLKESKIIPPVNPGLKLMSRLNQIEIESNSNQCDWIEEDERRVKNLTEIIDKLKSNPIVIEMLRHLAVYLDFTVLNSVELRPNELLTEADVNDMKVGRLRRLTLVVALLTAITEQESLIASLFSDLASALPVVESLLKTHRQRCSDLELAHTRETFLINCVMLLSCYLAERNINGKMASSEWRALKEIVPTLKHLKGDSQNAALTGLAEQLLQMILTHGVIGANAQDDAESSQTSTKKQALITDRLPTVASSSVTGSPPVTSETSRSSTPSASKSRSTSHPQPLTPYQEALLDACSLHLPVRGHALISLTKLVQVKDEEAMRNSDRILSLFEYHLRDEDSYVYLASIEGLVALSAQFPHKIVTILTEEFAGANQSVETRLKLVEILTKTTRCLGPMLPKYKSFFLNCLLNGVRDKDDLIRASCLSNLGEVCKELRFGVEPVLHEVFTLVENVIQNDKSLEVKRAAVLLITLLLQGLGKDSLKVLQAVILDIYRSLKRLASKHSDSVLATQAELALQEINAITKEFLLPKINLSKKIFVTEVPPDFL